MLVRIHKRIVRKWIISRMAAQEFYFHGAFDIAEEWPLLKILLVLALLPLEAIFVFAYARFIGSLSHYALPIIIMLIILNIVIANDVINRLKDDPMVDEAMASYNAMSPEGRKKSYSFGYIAPLIFVIALLPWLIMGVAIGVICLAEPK